MTLKWRLERFLLLFCALTLVIKSQAFSQFGLQKPLQNFKPPLSSSFVEAKPYPMKRSFLASKLKRTSLLSSSSEGDEAEEKLEDTNISEKFATFTEMALPYYKESSAGRWLFAGMIALTLLNSGVSVAFSYVGKDFWNALNSKDTEQFYTMLWRYAAALLVGSPVSVLYTFQRERLAISWREWMTDRCLQLYSSNRVYYNLERGSEIDNPDQRITEDVRSFTTFSLTLFLTLLTSVIDLVSFSMILYSIQPQLFGAIILYALFGTVTTTALGKKLVGLNYQKLQKEADFRYALVRVRDNAESIAFYAGEDIENKEINARLEKVIENKKDIIGARYLFCFLSLFLVLR